MPRVYLFVIFGLLSSIGFAVAGDKDDDDGAIDVKANESGAQVYLEGVRAGESPVKIDGVPHGTYRVVVRKDGCADYIEDVNLEKRQTISVDAKLAAGASTASVRPESDYKTVQRDDEDKLKETRPEISLKKYTALELGNFLCKSESPVPPKYLYLLLRAVAKQLDEKSSFETLATTFTKPPSDRWKSGVDSSAQALVLTGVITRYEGGNRAVRYMVGFGAGKTKMCCLFRLVDKKTGEVVFEQLQNGSVSFGFGGGDSSDAFKEVAENIVKSIRKERKD